ncbi:uncharacterized protein TrAtP1_009649 [Trichoderma atroviride]|uniref:uncharacterized protein n=1 Tax=Hypocrea atroviridis TaxID=63577 RepID=UPI00332DA49D|nr:hypothetical protein TrAtP1_009649 [Trichoderma atroviride]
MQEASVVCESSESIYDAAQLCSEHFERQLQAADGAVGGNYREIEELWGRFNKRTADAGALPLQGRLSMRD